MKESKQLSLLRSGTGTQVFVFIGRDRKHVQDWCWEIWRELGGELPRQLIIKIPELESTITLPVPDEDIVGGSETCKALSRPNILRTCTEALDKIPYVKQMMEQAKHINGEDIQLELAWQRNDELNWITSQDERTSEGRRRDWSVLAGFALTGVSGKHCLLYHPRR